MNKMFNCDVIAAKRILMFFSSDSFLVFFSSGVSFATQSCACFVSFHNMPSCSLFQVTGRDNNNIQIYQEKQRDHRKSDSDSASFRNAADNSRAAASHAALQNANQQQGIKNQYGVSDRLLDAAGKKAEDFNTFQDNRHDLIWNADRARDSAFRGAEDLATKNGKFLGSLFVVVFFVTT